MEVSSATGAHPDAIRIFYSDITCIAPVSAQAHLYFRQPEKRFLVEQFNLWFQICKFFCLSPQLIIYIINLMQCRPDLDYKMTCHSPHFPKRNISPRRYEWKLKKNSQLTSKSLRVRQLATHVCQLSYRKARISFWHTLHSGIIDSTSILMLGADNQNNQLSIQKSTALAFISLLNNRKLDGLELKFGVDTIMALPGKLCLVSLLILIS